MALVTVYDLLEVEENASKEEIEKSYQRLILEYHKDPKLSEEENNDNEIILNKLKLAYDILSNDEKRKKYDNELAKRRAEELIKNVSVEPSNNYQNENLSDNIETEREEQLTNQNVNSNINSINYQEQEEYDDDADDDDENITLSSEEKAKLKKAAQKEFKDNLKKAQKAEEEYNKAYNEAYNSYLRKMGYNVKEPWTVKRVKNLIITILVIVVVCALIWFLPPTRNLLMNIYEENVIIKSLVDIVVMLVNAIIGAFK